MMVREDILCFDPQLPQEVGRIAFELFYRGQHVRVGLSAEALACTGGMRRGAHPGRCERQAPDTCRGRKSYFSPARGTVV